MGKFARLDSMGRFWAKVNKTETCWLWTGNIRSGYGTLRRNSRHRQAHRFLYEHIHGPVDPQLDICHKCDVRACVNPGHLFVGTRKDNMQDAKAKGRIRIPNKHKSHCRHGHKMTPENTYLNPKQPEQRVCRICKRRKHSEWKNRLRSALASAETPNNTEEPND